MADEQNKIALFIDADNIPAKYGKIIIETLQSRGEIFIRRIYGNWEKNSLHTWNECILKYGLLAVQQMDFSVGKNATDMSLTIDAIEVLYQRQATIFAIVSGDSDFTPLAVKLRERGVYVIGLGKEQASASFRSACNEFIDLNTLNLDEVEREEKISEVKKSTVEKIINNSESEVKKNSSSAKIPARKIADVKNLSANKKNYSTKKNSAEKNLPADKKNVVDKDFSSAAKKLATTIMTLKNKPNKISGTPRGKSKIEFSPALPAPVSKVVSISTSLLPKKNISLSDRFVKCGQNGMRKPKKKLQQIHEVLHESAKAHADANGFAPLNCAGHDLKQKNLGFGIKDFGYSLLHEFINDFPDLYELIRTKTGGRSFRYRCLKKLRQTQQP